MIIKARSGFTIVELLIVVVVIAIFDAQCRFVDWYAE